MVKLSHRMWIVAISSLFGRGLHGGSGGSYLRRNTAGGPFPGSPLAKFASSGELACACLAESGFAGGSRDRGTRQCRRTAPLAGRSDRRRAGIVVRATALPYEI